MSKDTRKLTSVQLAYERHKPLRQALNQLRGEWHAESMETTEDKAGIVWERWLVETRTKGMVSVIVFSTPSWWDLFVPIAQGRDVEGTLEALTKLTES